MNGVFNKNFFNFVELTKRNSIPVVKHNVNKMDNEELKLAERVVKYTNSNLFLTGRAGTGKTTFLRQMCSECKKRKVVLAPTGIAAINAGGSTIHSFFQLPFTPYVPGSVFKQDGFKLRKDKIKMIRSLELIIIDEISMVRADLLDHIDATLKRLRHTYDRPFGGVQMLMIGDLQQLSPVAKESEWAMLRPYYDTPYFFSSNVFKACKCATIELRQVYRQSDSLFLDLLARVRDNTADVAVLAELNKRYIPNFQPKKEDGYIRLVTHNAIADNINQKELNNLTGRAYTYQAVIDGKFPEYSYPTADILTLKEGAQVMFVKNDPEHAYYNGSIGTVTRLDSEGFNVHLQSGGDVCVEPMEWENTRYVLNEETKEIEEITDGMFRQYPVKLAWAITIHKSQGLTFDRAIIDARRAFSHGQTYVALSRLRTLEGLVLSTPLPQSAIITDWNVVQFTQTLGQNKPAENELSDMERDYQMELLDDLFSMEPLKKHLNTFIRLLDEFYRQMYPATYANYRNWTNETLPQLETVSANFHKQYDRLLSGNETIEHNTLLQERLQKGADYFIEPLAALAKELSETTLKTNNKEGQKRTDETYKAFTEWLSQRLKMLAYVSREGLKLESFLRYRALVFAGLDGDDDIEKTRQMVRQRKERIKKSTKKIADASDDLKYPQLYEQLRVWRLDEARKQDVPAFVIFNNAELKNIAKLLPETKEQLGMISGVGEKKLEMYGNTVLEIVNNFVKNHKIDRNWGG